MAELCQPVSEPSLSACIRAIAVSPYLSQLHQLVYEPAQSADIRAGIYLCNTPPSCYLPWSKKQTNKDYVNFVTTIVASLKH
jgi:hypothetical protein